MKLFTATTTKPVQIAQFVVTNLSTAKTFFKYYLSEKAFRILSLYP